MKTFLMYRDRDFDLERPRPSNEEALTQDLELNTVLNAMALGDKFLLEVARTALLSSLTDPEAITYRQRILADCRAQPEAVRAIYRVAVEALQAERKVWGLYSPSPDSLLHRSVTVLELFIVALRRLRDAADEHAGAFRSEGFTRFFEMIARELDDGYFRTIEHHLKELRFRRGVVMSAELGRGNKGARYVLRRPKERGWMERMAPARHGSFSFEIADRDDNGIKALQDLRGRGINVVANALARSTDHILSFFDTLTVELAFYVGCLNLDSQITQVGGTTCYPVALDRGTSLLSAEGLYDLPLTLTLHQRAIGNDVYAESRPLVVITGANQGGKSTFLRSMGVAQLMMQSGMFVAAESFSTEVCDGVYTHYKREEDATMESGKLDEELSRMSDIADEIAPGCVLLCNESFGATNEREGSEIARQIVRAMLEGGVRVLFVTHLFDLAHGYFVREPDTTYFLRAERTPDGGRSFRLLEGEPLPTSYGVDSYRKILGDTPANAG